MLLAKKAMRRTPNGEIGGTPRKKQTPDRMFLDVDAAKTDVCIRLVPSTLSPSCRYTKITGIETRNPESFDR